VALVGPVDMEFSVDYQIEGRLCIWVFGHCHGGREEGLCSAEFLAYLGLLLGARYVVPRNKAGYVTDRRCSAARARPLGPPGSAVARVALRAAELPGIPGAWGDRPDRCIMVHNPVSAVAAVGVVFGWKLRSPMTLGRLGFLHGEITDDVPLGAAMVCMYQEDVERVKDLYKEHGDRGLVYGTVDGIRSDLLTEVRLHRFVDSNVARYNDQAYAAGALLRHTGRFTYWLPAEATDLVCIMLKLASDTQRLSRAADLGSAGHGSE